METATTTTKFPATVIATVFEIRRLGCSKNGNPAWELRTSSGYFRTKSDASVSYGLPNLFGWDRDGSKRRQRENMTLHLTRNGRVTGVQTNNGTWI